MSPEAARGEDVDHRTDIYAVGVILFDMLTGRPPFEAESAAEVLAMQINQPPASPRAMAPQNEITKACERLILKALAKDPARRHQSIDELRDEMQHCYGSVAYHRAPSSFPDIPLPGPEARQQPRLTDELDEWLQSDQSRMSLDQARILALAAPAAESFSAPAMSPDEEERLAAALDAALGDEGDEGDES
jgi:serine/threonine-protein kinase